jgi:ATP/maltotriose-dependent transcriptional regulator MalT
MLATLDMKLAKAPARQLDGGGTVDLAVAEVLVRRGLYEDARAVLPRQPPSSAPTAYRTRWAVTAAAIQYWGAGDVEAADRVLDDVGGPVAEAHRAGFALLAGRPRAALAAGEKVLRDRQLPNEAIPPAVNTAVTAASLVGRFDLAMAAIDRAGPAQLEVAQLGYVHCFALLMAGRMEQAHRMAEDGYRDTVAAGNIAVAGGWSTLRGQVAKARGDLSTAIADLDTGSRLLEGYATSPVLMLCLAELAAARAMVGDRAGAQQTLRLAADQAPANGLFAPWFALSQAWTTAAGGDTTLAAKQAESAADRAIASGQFAVEAMARYDVARLGKPNAVRHRLATLAGLVRGPVVPVMAGAAAALARSQPGALDVATARFAELGLDLLAAETATAASALRHAAAPPRGLACPDATTPLLRLTAPLLRLTRRERDVALLAATGLTSPAIGHRLRLSARTVDNYLGRAYQKLGVADRRDLAPLVIGDRARLLLHSEGNHR